MANFTTFLFDLDGTLIDNFAAIARTHAHTCEIMGLPPPSPAQVRAVVGGGLENALLAFVPAPRLAEAIALYRDYFPRTMLDDVVLMPGARELLEGLRARGAKLAVLTNKMGDPSRLICEHLGVAGYFGLVVGALDTPWIKPEPKLVAYVLQKLGSEPSVALLVGDSPYDVHAALNAGLSAWCVTTGTHDAGALREAGAERVFASLAELGKALSGP